MALMDAVDPFEGVEEQGPDKPKRKRWTESMRKNPRNGTHAPTRPRGGFNPDLDWPKMTKWFVEGELQLREDGRGFETKYPTLTDVARKMGCHHSIVAKRAERYNWLILRANFADAVQTQVDRHLVEARARLIVEPIEIADRLLNKFSESVNMGNVRTDCIADLDRLIRLREFILGNADSKKEVRHVLSLEQMQGRHREVRSRQLLAADPSVAGVLTVEGEEVPDDEPDDEFEELAPEVAAPVAAPAPPPDPPAPAAPKPKAKPKESPARRAAREARERSGLPQKMQVGGATHRRAIADSIESRQSTDGTETKLRGVTGTLAAPNRGNGLPLSCHRRGSAYHVGTAAHHVGNVGGWGSIPRIGLGFGRLLVRRRSRRPDREV